VDVVLGGALVVVGSGIAGSGATTVCLDEELYAMTSAANSATTSSTAPPAANHSQRGDLGGSGSCGGPPGGIWP
jgi:hypothetical protein